MRANTRTSSSSISWPIRRHESGESAEAIDVIVTDSVRRHALGYRGDDDRLARMRRRLRSARSMSNPKKRKALFEPVHGSRPTSPEGLAISDSMIASSAWRLRYHRHGRPRRQGRCRDRTVLARRLRTADISRGHRSGKHGADGEAILKELQALHA